MQVWEIREFGLDKLALTERTEPQPGSRQVLVKLRAASLNYRDLMVVQGAYNRNLRLPLVPLSDGVGDIVAVGDEVTRVAVGARVAGIFMQGWIEGAIDEAKARTALGGNLDGVLADYVVFDEEGVVPVPAHLSDEQAATLPCAAVTAWHALMEPSALRPGASVLLQGTGGVSLFALQFAKLAGARIILTSSSDEKLERAKGLGVTDGINYRTMPEWARRVRELTDGIGVDHVVEVGGAGTLGQSLQAVRMGGTVSVIGALGGAGEVNPIPILMRSIKVQGIYVGSRAMFEAMNRAFALHRITPVVDRVFPFADVREALSTMQSGSHFGKIAIRF